MAAVSIVTAGPWRYRESAAGGWVFAYAAHGGVPLASGVVRFVGARPRRRAPCSPDLPRLSDREAAALRRTIDGPAIPPASRRVLGVRTGVQLHHPHHWCSADREASRTLTSPMADSRTHKRPP